MIFNFPSSHRYTAGHPPLVLAVAQVNFPLVASFAALDGMRAVQERLQARFPVMRRALVNSLAISIGPPIAPAPPFMSSPEAQWIFQSEDGYEATVTSGGLKLAIGAQYVDREHFAAVWRDVLDALSSTGQIKRCDAVAVRYINAAATANLPWQEWFKPQVAGWAGEPCVQASQRWSLATTTLEGIVNVASAEISSSVIARNGYVLGIGPDVTPNFAGPAFVIDCEISTKQSHLMETDFITALYTAFNREIATFFNWTLTDKGCEHFGIQVIAEEGDGL